MKYIIISCLSLKSYYLEKILPRLSLEASTFLNGKGILEKMDDYNIIRVFCSHEKPIFLPYYVSDKLFIIEVERQYKLWFHTFYEKRKN
jgi:hypothetical protein